MKVENENDAKNDEEEEKKMNISFHYDNHFSRDFFSYMKHRSDISTADAHTQQGV
jgi:hypothetical protein